MLLAAIWMQWARLCDAERSRTESPPPDTDCVQAVFCSQTAKDLPGLVLRSQIAFAVLAVGFIYYTAIFWTQIIRNGDKTFFARGGNGLSAVDCDGRFNPFLLGKGGER